MVLVLKIKSQPTWPKNRLSATNKTSIILLLFLRVLSALDSFRYALRRGQAQATIHTVLRRAKLGQRFRLPLRELRAVFFGGSFSSGFPSIRSPMASSTTRRALTKKSRSLLFPLLARLGMCSSCHGISADAIRCGNQTDPLPTCVRRAAKGARTAH